MEATGNAHRFVSLIFLSVFSVSFWLVYDFASDTYAFWKHGVERRMSVIDLDHTSRSGKGVTSFYDIIEIDGRRMTKYFQIQLPVKKFISVLVLPDNPDKVALGNRNSSPFKIFLYSMGGDAMAIFIYLLSSTCIAPCAPFRSISA